MSQPTPAARRKRRYMKPALAGLILLAVALHAGKSLFSERITEVSVETASSGPVQMVLALNGRVTARHTVQLRPAVSAQVTGIHADEGDMVQAGDLLVTLDTDLMEARRAQAEATLAVQEARATQAENAAERARRLGAAVISRASLEEAELDLATAKGEVARLRAALTQVEREAAEYKIRAPISGLLLSREVDPGQIVSMQDALFVLADTVNPVIETEADELYADRIAVGMRALLQPVGRAEPQPGRVSFAAPQVDPNTGGRKLKLDFDQATDLPIGLTVNANVIVGEKSAAITLPRSAILSGQNGAQILLMDDGRARLRTIRFADWPADRVVIEQGLAEGEQVILAPENLRDGDRVTVR